jgi:hypothetical protein
MMEQQNSTMRLHNSDKPFIDNMLFMIVPKTFTELFWNTHAQFQAHRPNQLFTNYLDSTSQPDS